MGALSVQGTTSWAGKSLLATALCRLFARRGVRVAPFKAQNMSNNARVVAGGPGGAHGGEIGVAQWLQAHAARVTPDARMNPVLVKPEADTRSQVVVNGRADLALSRLPWRERAPQLWAAAEAALHELLDEFDVVVLEGAGSPAEINLRGTDLANMRSARVAGAPVLLAADIDRGGAFAHLYGTWALLPPEEQASICGFVLNRFRGDPALLAPAPAMLEELTGVPTLGVVPLFRHALPDEDGAADPSWNRGPPHAAVAATGAGTSAGAGTPAARRPRVAVVRYPLASNLDELKPLEEVADVAFATGPEPLAGADLVVLPGSKHVASDLAWLRASGVAAAVAVRAAAGRPVLGVCGGAMMLGGSIDDPDGVEGSARGLGLLPLDTVLRPEKTVRLAERAFLPLDGAWAALGGVAFAGYDIRHGELRLHDGARPVLPGEDGGAAGAVAGSLLGVATHGLFEAPAVVEALLGAAPALTLDAALDGVADAVGAHLPVDRLLELALAARRPARSA